jgi:hypothetical protein
MRVIDRMTNVVLRHFEATGHPLWRPYHERGMNWVWCRVDKTFLDSV